MSKVYMENGKLVVPDQVTIPFIEGDGVGAEITPVCQQVVNAAVEAAYHGPEERRSSRPVNGCRRLRWRLSASIWSVSRDR